MKAIKEAIEAICYDVTGDSDATQNRIRSEAIFGLVMADILAPVDLHDEVTQEEGVPCEDT